MKKIIVILLSIFLFSICCTTIDTRPKYRPKYKVFIFRHPDHMFFATNSANVKIYDGFTPEKQFFIIGKIAINQLPEANYGKINQKIKKVASRIGGQAVIILDTIKETKEFGDDDFGIIIPQKDWIYLLKTKRKTTASIIRRYGFVVRWKDDSVHNKK